MKVTIASAPAERSTVCNFGLSVAFVVLRFRAWEEFSFYHIK
jgi:hypothetical protein